MTGEHLLIVDDEDNLRSMLAAALRHNGFVVSAAVHRTRGAQGDGRPADIRTWSLLDVMMPDLDGFEVCRRIAPTVTGPRWLFLTARDSTERQGAGG